MSDIREILRETHYAVTTGYGIDRAFGKVDLALELGLISQEEHIGWIHKLKLCPGHEGEGGRVWCAYCGYIDLDLKEGRHVHS